MDPSSLRIDVLHLQPCGFTDPQPRGVQNERDRPVLRRSELIQKPTHLGLAENLGQSFLVFWRGMSATGAGAFRTCLCRNLRALSAWLA